MIYIEIGELIGNAFISYFEATGKRVLSFSKINKFGEKIVNELNKNEKRAILYFYKYKTEEFFEEYSDWFKTVDIRREVSVVMSNNITTDDLRKKFSGYLSLEVMKVFRNSENVKVLLEE